jgi:hypothetical protein
MNIIKPVKKEQKEFDAVGFMRERRTKIASETEGMNFSELKKYFAQRKVKATNSIFNDGYFLTNRFNALSKLGIVRTL